MSSYKELMKNLEYCKSCDSTHWFIKKRQDGDYVAYCSFCGKTELYFRMTGESFEE